MNLMSFSLVLPFSLFSFKVLLPHRSLLPLAVLFLSSLLLLLLLFFVFFIKASHTQWHVTVDVSKFESASSSSFRVFVSFRFIFIVSAFTSHAKWKVAVCVFELLSATSFTFLLVVSLIFFVFQCRYDY